MRTPCALLLALLAATGGPRPVSAGVVEAVPRVGGGLGVHAAPVLSPSTLTGAPAGLLSSPFLALTPTAWTPVVAPAAALATMPVLPAAAISPVKITGPGPAIALAQVQPAASESKALGQAIAAAEKAAKNQALAEFFDGERESMRGTFKNGPEVEPVDHAANLTPALVSRLAKVKELSTEEFHSLLKDLSRSSLKVRGPPAFAEDHTYSFELEFQVSRQITADDLKSLFKGKKALSKSEWEDWNERRELDSSRWKKVWRFVVARVRGRMPRGWRLTSDSSGEGRNTLEILTGGAAGKYHRNTPEEFAELVAGIERVEDVLPGGFYSVHMHAGRESLTSGKTLNVAPSGFARLVKMFEAQWRVLAGRGYTVPASTAVEMMPAKALDPYRARSLANDHSVMLNLHFRYPTIENRLLSGLLSWSVKKQRSTLNPAKLAQHMWWSFSLLQRASEGAPPLAAMGLPVVAGQKPSPAQIALFADDVYGDDLVGKALALKRFARRVDEEGQLTPRELADARRETRAVYSRLGLAVVYDLHDAAGGYEPAWREKLAEPQRRGRLLDDLFNAGASDIALSEYFPKDLAAELNAELNPMRRSVANPWRRLLRAWRRVANFFR